MATIVLRSVKGSPLTNAEVDANFSNINTELGQKLTGNQTITISGDASGSGTTGISLTLASVGTAGTYTKVTVDSKGRVTLGAALASADLPTYTGTLTSSQVTSALGFTPYNSTNPSGYISGITSGMVTTALGFTPYNATNPAGYITPSFLDDYTRGNYRVIADYNGGSTWYIRNNGTFVFARGFDWTESFLIDISTGTSGTNNGWALIGQKLSNLANGTWGGTRFVRYAGGAVVDGYVRGARFYLGDDTNYITVGSGGAIRSQTASGYLDIGSMNSGWAHFQTDRPSFYFGTNVRVDGALYRYSDDALYLHSANFNSYSPTLTGGGASGTWGINITGNAATATSATDSTKLPLSGGTITGSVTATDNIVARGILRVQNGTADWDSIDLDAEGATHIINARGAETGLSFRFDNVERLFLSNGGVLSINGNTALHAGNFNSYSPTLTGGGASGTWSINVTGNAATVSSITSAHVTNALGYTPYPNVTPNGYATGDISGTTAHQRLWGTDSVQDMFAFNPPTEVEYSTNGSTWVATTISSDVFDGKVYGEHSGFSANVGNNVGAWRFVRFTWRNFGYRFWSHFTLGHSTNGHSFNFVFYKSDLNGNFGAEAFRSNGINSWPGYTFVKHENVSGWWDTRDIRIVLELNHNNDYPNNGISIGHIGMMGSYGGFQRLFDWNASRSMFFANAFITGSNHQVLHAGNFSSYSPTLTGAGASGTWGINISGNAATASNSSLLNGFASSAAGGASVVLRTDTNGYLYLYNWINTGSGGLFSGTNGSHFYPNNTTFGSWRMAGSRNGYTGISMDASNGQVVFMANVNSNLTGFYNESYGWQMLWSDGSLSCFKNAYGGGTQATVLDSVNYSNYTINRGGDTLTSGVFYFQSNRDTNSSNPPLQAYSSSGGAIMSFHRGGVFAVNMGLDSDNVFRIGGWSAAANRLQMDMSGNLTMAGFVRAGTNVYADANYGYGLVGLYASTRYQGVFAMGDAYKLPADGTTTGSLYGIAWSHPNTGGVAGNLDSHGMLVLINGGFGSAMSYSIVASGNVTAYSDERLKTNWRSMPENFVERLAAVKVGVYDRKDGERISQVGVSAQSLQELLPEAVTTAKDEMQTLSVSYGNAAMASAVELAKEIVALKRELAALKSKLH